MKLVLLASLSLAAPVASLRALPTSRVQRTAASTGPAALSGKTSVLPRLGAEEVSTAVAAPAAAALLAMGTPTAALAKEGAYGFLEKKLPALVHPAIMGVVFLVSINAAITGFKWRQLRSVTSQVNELKAQLKPLAAKAEAEESPSAALTSQIRELESDINSLTATRKDLSSANLRDTHWQMGSILLGLGTSFAIEGPVNTYMRAGKLFPGPHLYAGAGCVVAWALAASLVPLMQKGNEGARLGHIGLNVAGTGMFVWQIQSGFQILQKVWEKVPW